MLPLMCLMPYFVTIWSGVSYEVFFKKMRIEIWQNLLQWKHASLTWSNLFYLYLFYYISGNLRFQHMKCNNGNHVSCLELSPDLILTLTRHLWPVQWAAERITEFCLKALPNDSFLLWKQKKFQKTKKDWNIKHVND